MKYSNVDITCNSIYFDEENDMWDFDILQTPKGNLKSTKNIIYSPDEGICWYDLIAFIELVNGFDLIVSNLLRY